MCVDLVTKHCSDGTVATTEVVAEVASEEAADRKKREAEPFYGYGGYGLHGYAHHVAPIAYHHIPKCTTEETTLTHKVCTPKTEKKCEDVTYKTIVSINNSQILKIYNS